MHLFTALLIFISSLVTASPQPQPQNVLTIKVYTHHTEIIDNGELVTSFDDSCRNPRIWNTNAHTCNGNVDLLTSIIDGYVPMPYHYAEAIVRYQT